MKQKFSVAILLLMLIGLAGCGGSGGTVATPTGKVEISWPARSRQPLDVPLTSALSAKLTFTGSGGGLTPLEVNVDRQTSPEAYVGSYDLPAGFTASYKRLTVQFYAQATQSGAVVGSATSEVTSGSGGLILESVQLDKEIQSLAVVPAVLSVGAPATQLQFTARDSEGNLVAISAGSGVWTLESGSTVLGLTSAGAATALTAGTANVRVSVDSVTSPQEVITVQIDAGLLEWVNITPANYGNWFNIAAVEGDQIIGQRGVYDNNGVASGLAGAILTPSFRQLSCFEVLGSDGISYVGTLVEDTPSAPRNAVLIKSDFSELNLTPADAAPGSGSTANDVDGDIQVGAVRFNTDPWQTHAVLWRGTPGSIVDLHPDSLYPPVSVNQPGTSTSARYVSGNLIAGSANEHACAWTNLTKFSFVDLNPDGYTKSAVTGCDEGRIIGYGRKISAGYDLPLLWRTPERDSVIELPTDRSTNGSALYIDDNFIVGRQDNDYLVWNATNLAFRRFELTPPTGQKINQFGGIRKTATGIDLVFRMSAVGSNPSQLYIYKIPTSMLP